MSRRRKRRGRSGPQGPQTVSEDNATNDIEIVDDVGVLGPGGQAAGAEASAAAGPAEVDAAPEPTQAEASGSQHDPVSDASTDAAAPSAADDGADHAPDDELAAEVPESAAVHVVDSLHDFPRTTPSGERNVETLGELLQHAREARGLSLEEASARTRIALLTLRHLENDRFGEIPAEAYVKGFLRSYGAFLNLDVAMLLRRYEKLSGHVTTPVAEIWDEVEVKPARWRLWTPSRRTVAFSSAVLIVAALAWVFWSQGAVMLGLRPEGELQQIEMQLRRESQGGGTPPAPITGLDDAALQQDSAASEVQQPGAPPPEDTAPTVPVPPEKPAGEDEKDATGADNDARKPQVDPQSGQDTTADRKPVVDKPKPAQKPAPKPVEKPKKKPPAPSPEDAAGPPG